jgi:organic hydroperoxide reductase OsmC/OhrA
MPKLTIQLRSIAGTEAAAGWAGQHTVVVDRPDGKAGGKGLGFNGGQLLALSIGGCLCNDIHYAAHELGIKLEHVAVDVELTLEGEPLIARQAHVSVDIRPADPDADVEGLLRRAEEISTVSNSLRRGVPVMIKQKDDRA